MLTGAHWKRSYDGRVYRHATITRYVLGVGPELQAKLGDLYKHIHGNLSCEDEREEQLRAVQENIRKAATGETVPLPRDLLMDLRVEKREQKLLLDQSHYEAEKGAKLAEQASKGSKRKKNKKKKVKTMD